MAKRMVRQVLFGLPGPQQSPIESSQLETRLAAAASMLNAMTYLDENNRLLLSPSDFITPWKFGSPSVQETPVTKHKSLVEARRMLTMGCVVLVDLKEHAAPELGVVQSIDGGNVTVRLRNRLFTTSSQCSN